MKIRAISATIKDELQLQKIIEKWGLIISNNAPFVLSWDGERLSISNRDFPAIGAHFVDFVGGAVGHRRRFGGGRGQTIAKAVGLKSGHNPIVVDATAGWGRDAFLLASLGCRVTMIERSPVVAALLEDGLRRAQADPEIGAMVTERLRLVSADAVDWLSHCDMEPDVIYIDPMFPHRTKTAQVKKESFYLQQLLGPATDGDELLEAALNVAGYKRVVVKRPKQAPLLADRKPTHSYMTKNHRFDTYIKG